MDKEMLIVVSKVKPLLTKNPSVKTVSAEALSWISDVTGQVAKNLADSGRKSPSGRLMAPKMDAGLMARSVAKQIAFGEPYGGGELPVTKQRIDQIQALPPVPERLDARAKEVLQANGGQRRGFPVAEDEMDAYLDWKYEVGNGDTLLGFREWQENKAEQLREMTTVEIEDKSERTAK